MFHRCPKTKLVMTSGLVIVALAASAGREAKPAFRTYLPADTVVVENQTYRPFKHNCSFMILLKRSDGGQFNPAKKDYVQVKYKDSDKTEKPWTYVEHKLSTSKKSLLVHVTAIDPRMEKSGGIETQVAITANKRRLGGGTGTGVIVVTTTTDGGMTETQSNDIPVSAIDTLDLP